MVVLYSLSADAHRGLYTFPPRRSSDLDAGQRCCELVCIASRHEQADVAIPRRNAHPAMHRADAERNARDLLCGHIDLPPAAATCGAEADVPVIGYADHTCTFPHATAGTHTPHVPEVCVCTTEAEHE